MAELQKDSTQTRPAPASSDEAAPKGKTPVWQRAPAIVAGTLVLAGLLFLALNYLAESLTHEWTDDAFIDADTVFVAPKVAGQIRKVFVVNNQRVKAGDPLTEVDPTDLQVVLDQKKTAVETAKANVDLLLATIDLFRAEIAAAEATARQTAAEAAASQATGEKANADLKRAQELMLNHTISPQEFDTSKAGATAAESNWSAAREKAASDKSKVAQSQAQLIAGLKALERGRAQTRQAELEAKAAELNVSYTRVAAPQDGYITQKAVESGDYVQAGQRLLALVPIRLFVTANFKETQVRYIRPGQPVTIGIDSLSSGPFSGRVESLQAGSGATFSLLPPENAVGNYVKVVQRIPVRIQFDQPVESDHVLGPGMSVVPSVRVSETKIPEWAVALAAAAAALIAGAIWARAARRGREWSA